MFTIVGLGNPGEEYAATRHNVGWIVLSRIILKRNLPEPHISGSLHAAVSDGMLEKEECRILFPHTYMNRSGISVKKALIEAGEVAKLIVVHDDIDLPLGDVRISVARGAGGHNGVRDIIDSLGTLEFIRIRIGIARVGIFGMMRRPTGEALSRFVLSPFSNQELEKLEMVTEEVDHALSLVLTHGVEKAMQEINA